MNRIALMLTALIMSCSAQAKEPDCQAMRAQLAYVVANAPHPLTPSLAKRVMKLREDILVKCEALGK